VARRVNQVELIRLAILRLIHHAHGMGFDGDAALALQVHVVENLGLHLALADGAGEFEQAVAQRRLSVVDVGDDGEVSDESGFHCRHVKKGLSAAGARSPLRSSLSSRKVRHWHLFCDAQVRSNWETALVLKGHGSPTR
jgi:hypothetical protein